MVVGLKTEILPAGEVAVAAAARRLENGGLVAFPTETVYGLGADAANVEAIARLYQAKGRPAFNPLIAHVSDRASAQRIAHFDATALALADAFWPGPLTLVLPKTASCPVADLATAGLDTVAIRVPAHPVAQDILRRFGGAVVAPSANLSGHVSPTAAAHVQGDLAGRIDLIVDGGPVAVGVESTIVGCFETPMLLRPGGVPRTAIERVLGRPLLRPPEDPEADSDQPLAPGMLASHYAPRTRVRLNAVNIEPGEALLAFGPIMPAGFDRAAAVMNLSARGDLTEAAAHLFGYLRALDDKRASAIAVMPVPNDDLGEAINDRLRRAAVPQTGSMQDQRQSDKKVMNIVPPKPALPPLSPDLIARFKAIVGDKYAVTDANELAQYVTEERNLFHGHSPLVLRPASTAEVSAICKLATEQRIALVPQGGNTGLVGGQTPHNGEVVVSMRRMDKIREVDVASNTMTVEAGVVLQNAQQRASDVDRFFPLSLGAEGSCTIGGNLSTNAGGTGALAFGVAREMALGLEVVLADGRILNGLSKLKKDNTGYDLRNLFIGAEGTLGIITAAVLKLFPKPRSVETAFVGLKTPADALKLLTISQAEAAGSLTSFELLAEICIDMCIKHGTDVREPLQNRHPWYVLMEVSSSRDDARATLETILGRGMEDGIVDDAVIAANLQQRAAFWKLREVISPAQKPEGGSIKHDISVPVAAVPAFIEEANAAVVKLIPGARPVPFGHLGDGNIHYNVSQPVSGMTTKHFLDLWHEVNAVVFAIVLRMGGSISAEHGIGVLKRDELPDVKDKTAIELMRGIKTMFDPQGIMNPGKVL